VTEISRSASADSGPVAAIPEENLIAVCRVLDDNPNGLLHPSDVIRAAQDLRPTLHARLASLGAEPSMSTVVGQLITVVETPTSDNLDRCVAVELIGRANEVIFGKYIFASGLSALEQDQVVDALVSALNSRDLELRISGLRAAERFGRESRAKGVRAVANGLLDDTSENLRLGLRILEKIERDLAAIAVPQLIALLAHPNEATVVETACRILQLVGDKSAETIGSLLRLAFGGTSSQLRRLSMSTVVSLAPPLEVFSDQVDEYGDRVSAIDLLAELGVEGRAFREHLLESAASSPAIASTIDEPPVETPAAMPYIDTTGITERRLKLAYFRDHLWLDWHEVGHLIPAAIRDRWNGMTDPQRREAIVRGTFDKIAEGANGVDLVKKALEKARNERQARS
jgi:hypothetical protein